MGEGSSGKQVFTMQSRRKELPGGMNGMYKGTKARQNSVCLGRCKWFRGPRKGVLVEKRKQGAGWHGKSETDRDLGPGTLCYNACIWTKYREKITACMHSWNKLWTRYKKAKKTQLPLVKSPEQGQKQGTLHAPCTHHQRGKQAT